MNNGLNKKIFFGFLTFNVIIFLITTGFAQPNKTIDQKVVQRIDVSGDGIEDEIIFHFKGESWDDPFKWSLTIFSKENKIFEYKSDDTRIDEFFNDEGYVIDCASYLECKKKYYLKDLISHLVVNTDLSPNFHAFSKENEGSIYFVAKKELIEKYKLSESDAIKTVDWMINRLKTKNTPVLYIQTSPVTSEYPMMYVDRVGTFVAIYNW